MRRISFRSLAICLLFACAGSGEPSADLSGGETGAILEEAQLARLPAWAHEYEEAGEYGGIGSLHARGLDTLASTALHLHALKVEVESAGQLAAFSVEHDFVNESDERLEGTFRFTLPRGAIVTGLAMEIDGKLMEGEILAREKAQKIYRDIVDSMRDPAILEWEQGRTFKLRVFPIEARGSKRIVLRYLAPLSPDPARAKGTYRIIYPTVAPEGQGLIDRFSFYVNDDLKIDRRDFEARGDLRIPLPRATSAPDLVVEGRGDHDYYAARIVPNWDQMATPTRHQGPRTRIIWIDSSRSGLESWGLAREAALSLVSNLGVDERFLVVSSDLFSTRHAPAPVNPSPKSLAQLEQFLGAIEPDGASDFAATINEIGSILKESAGQRCEVIYIGDGTPTWGALGREELAQRVAVNFGTSPLHALVVGKGGDPAFMQALVAPQAGRVDQPAGPADLRRFGVFLKHADRIKSLRGIKFHGGKVSAMQPPLASTLFEGREAHVYFALPKGERAPTHLTLTGYSGGEAFEQQIALGSAHKSEHVAQLWAARKIEALQAQGSKTEGAKEEIIALSEELGVLSRHTALLVLESEEAYRQHEIERRKAAEAREAEANDERIISGRDLESMGSATRLSPGDIQPGDPEIHIPAPEDARSVVAVFPFGETKIARWEPALGRWTLRFLIDAATLPGRYEVQIRIVHHDGRVEMRKAGYTVDTSAPFMKVSLIETEGEPGTFRVVATQELRESDRGRTTDQIGQGESGIADESTLFDAKSVDAIMPDGQTLTLRWVAAGRFEKRWTPRAQPQWPATIQLMATDRALNVRRMELQLAAPDPEALDGDE